MSYYAYKITRDYGFAPNPFYGYCTLACCKPHIRDRADVGDWIIGTGAIENHSLYHIIFLMKVTEKICFEDYWNDQRFFRKRPVLNGSLKQMHGDNIYHKEKGEWYQMDSHHSFHDGVLNGPNRKQDLSGNFVLVSNQFIYLGRKHFRVPQNYLELCPNPKQRDYLTIRNSDLAEEFINFMSKKYLNGVNGEPINWIEYTQLSLF